jgi:hypothetical protein
MPLCCKTLEVRFKESLGDDVGKFPQEKHKESRLGFKIPAAGRK